MRRLLLALAALGSLALAVGVAVAATPGTAPPAASPAAVPPAAARGASPCTKLAKPAKAKGLVLTLSPNPATVGQTLAVTGHLTGIKGRLGRCGAPIHLLWRGPGARGYSTVFAGHTTPAGAFRFTVAASLAQARVNGTWKAHSGNLNSRPVRHGVRARLAFASPVTYAVSGDQETFAGAITPAVPGQQLAIERNAGQGWSTVATQTLGSSQLYTITTALNQPGTASYRAQLQPGARNLRSSSAATTIRVAPATGIHKIRHVVIIMQENRSFDSYFGTYPGADGIPPGVCVPDPMTATCVAPFHDPADLNYGGPHGAANSSADVDGGAMDGFVAQAQRGFNCSSTDPNCSPCQQNPSPQPGQSQRCVDVMGYHDAREIPNYWAYAKNSSCRTTCSSPMRPGACPPTCSWSRSGRRCAADRSAHPRAATRSSHPTRTGQAGSPARLTDAGLRVDGHDLLLAQSQTSPGDVTYSRAVSPTASRTRR